MIAYPFPKEASFVSRKNKNMPETPRSARFRGVSVSILEIDMKLQHVLTPDH